MPVDVSRIVIFLDEGTSQSAARIISNAHWIRNQKIKDLISKIIPVRETLDMNVDRGSCLACVDVDRLGAVFDSDRVTIVNQLGGEVLRLSGECLEKSQELSREFESEGIWSNEIATICSGIDQRTRMVRQQLSKDLKRF